MELRSSVEWPSPKISGYSRLPPDGKLIEKIFDDWQKGKLRFEIDRTIYSKSDNSVFTICKIIGCSKYEDCNEMGEPHCIYVLGGPFRLGGLWRSLDKHTQRGIIILAILGKEGMRSGGYFRSDIKKIIGTKSNSSTDRVIETLCKLHILRKIKRKGKAPRFHYFRPDFLHKIAKSPNSKLMEREIEWLYQIMDEENRAYARNMIERLKKLVPPRTRKNAFIRDRDYSELTFGFLIGHQPPKWYVELYDIFFRLMLEVSSIPLEGRLSKPEEKAGWQGGEEEFDILFEKAKLAIKEKLKSIPKKERHLLDKFPLTDENDALIMLELPNSFRVFSSSSSQQDGTQSRG